MNRPAATTSAPSMRSVAAIPRLLMQGPQTSRDPPSSRKSRSRLARAGKPAAWMPSATPARTSSTPSAWKPRTTSTSEASAAQPITNGMVACSGWSGPCRTMKTSFCVSTFCNSVTWCSVTPRPAGESLPGGRSNEENLAALGRHQEGSDAAGAVDDRVQLGHVETQRVQRAGARPDGHLADLLGLAERIQPGKGADLLDRLGRSGPGGVVCEAVVGRDPVRSERIERPEHEEDVDGLPHRRGASRERRGRHQLVVGAGVEDCLLYTSDAADEEDSV